MKLHVFPPSPNAKKAIMVNHHLNLNIPLTIVDLQAGEQKSEAFLGLNPNGKIPVLEFDDGSTLWESNAIINRLAESGKLGLFPQSDDWIEVLRWQFWEAAHWTPACAKFISKYLFENDDVDLKKATEDFSVFATVLDRQLQAKPWLVGENMTNADISVAAILCYRRPCQYPLDGFENIVKWIEKIEKLPCWKAANSS